jgi:hypothetical protein
MRKLLSTIVLTPLVFLAVPRVALACPVCFGQSDAPMAWGTKMGVFFMLGITVCVLAAFAGFFIYLMRRAKLVADSESSGETEQYVLRAEGPVLHASEPRFFASDSAQGRTTRW